MHDPVFLSLPPQNSGTPGCLNSLPWSALCVQGSSWWLSCDFIPKLLFLREQSSSDPAQSDHPDTRDSVLGSFEIFLSSDSDEPDCFTAPFLGFFSYKLVLWCLITLFRGLTVHVSWSVLLKISGEERSPGKERNREQVRSTTWVIMPSLLLRRMWESFLRRVLGLQWFGLMTS